ncbi:DUF5667 domain-containing protein [Chloroflexota bacterium]
MKRIANALLVSIIAITMFTGSIAYAQDEGLPDPGITPDSPLYVFDNMGKKLGMLFTFGAEAKTRKAIAYAEERLAEAEAMAVKNRIREEERATKGYGEFLAIATEKMEETRNEGTSNNISELVASATARHLTVLDRVSDKVPDEAKEAIAKARESSMNGQQNALRLLARERMERAIEINIDTVEKRLARARAESEENNVEEVENAINDADRMLRLRDELYKNNKRQGQDTTSIEEKIAEANTRNLEALAAVYEKVPEQAKDAIQNAITNSIRNRETVVEALKSRGALGEIQEEVSLPERVRNALEVQERARERVSDTGNGTMERERVENQVEEQIRSRTSGDTGGSVNTPKTNESETTKQGSDSSGKR